MMVNDMGLSEKFERYVKDKPRHQTADLIYYLAYDLDYGKFIMENDFAITHNTIVIKKATVPSKKDIKKETIIEDYIFEWERK